MGAEFPWGEDDVLGTDGCITYEYTKCTLRLFIDIT